MEGLSYFREFYGTSVRRNAKQEITTHLNLQMLVAGLIYITIAFSHIR